MLTTKWFTFPTWTISYIYINIYLHDSRWQHTNACLCMTLQRNYELTKFKLFSKRGSSIWTRLENGCMNTVHTTKPQSMNKLYRTNQVYLIIPRCKSIWTVKKLCDVNNFSPVFKAANSPVLPPDYKCDHGGT